MFGKTHAMSIEEKLNLILEAYRDGKIHNPQWNELAVKVSGANNDNFRVFLEKVNRDGYVKNNEITADGLIFIGKGGYKNDENLEMKLVALNIELITKQLTDYDGVMTEARIATITAICAAVVSAIALIVQVIALE